MLIRNKVDSILTRKDIPELEGHLRDVSLVFNPGPLKKATHIISCSRFKIGGEKHFS